MALSFGQIEEIVLRAFSIAPEHKSRMRSRLQQWQKLGIPAGTNTGRGSRASYGVIQLFEVLTMASLVQRGLPPAAAIGLTQEAQTWSLGWTEALRRLAAGDRDEISAYVQCDMFADLRSEPGCEAGEWRYSVQVLSAAEVCSILSETGPIEYRAIERFGDRYFATRQSDLEGALCINLTRTLERVLAVLMGCTNFSERTDLAEEMQKLAQDVQEELALMGNNPHHQAEAMAEAAERESRRASLLRVARRLMRIADPADDAENGGGK